MENLGGRGVFAVMFLENLQDRHESRLPGFPFRRTHLAAAAGWMTFAFYAACMVGQLIWVLAVMPGTKGILLEKIQKPSRIAYPRSAAAYTSKIDRAPRTMIDLRCPPRFRRFPLRENESRCMLMFRLLGQERRIIGMDHPTPESGAEI